MKHFQEKIGLDKDKNYKYVSDDLYKKGIFDDNDNEIANNVTRKVKTIDELNPYSNNKRDYNNKFNNMLKEVDEEYRTTHINKVKCFNVMFAESKLMEMDTTEQNKVAMYLYNNIL